MKVYKAPEQFDENDPRVKIFLAGSIEMGKAEDWQTRITKGLEFEDCIILNPRRDDWDSTWEQKITNDKFYEQVNWELDALDAADIIAMYFDPSTKSPISLLELGLFARTKKLIVCCPEPFWRKGNVDIVCERYGIPLVETIEDLLYLVKEAIYDYGID